jgi:hypothetical protein
MSPWLIGLGAGLGKSMLIDQPREERQRQLEATKALYSPWTGMQPGQIQEADPFGSAMQGAMAGLMYEQQAGQQKLGQDLMKKQGQLIDAQTGLLKAQAGRSPAVVAGASQVPQGMAQDNIGDLMTYHGMYPQSPAMSMGAPASTRMSMGQPANPWGL